MALFSSAELDRLARKSAKTFAYSYGVKCALNLVFVLISAKQRRQLMKMDTRVLRSVVGSDSLRFGAFLSLLSSSYIALRRALHRYVGVEERSAWNPAIAGLLSGLSIVVDESRHRRHELALYVLARAMHAWIRYAQERGYLPDIPHGNTLCFAVLCGFIMYAFLYRPDTLKSSYKNFIGQIASKARMSSFLWFLREVHGVPHDTKHYFGNRLGLQQELFRS